RISDLAPKAYTDEGGIMRNLDTKEPIPEKDVSALKLFEYYSLLAQEKAFEQGNVGKIAVPGEHGKFNFYSLDAPVMKARVKSDQAGDRLLAEREKFREGQRNRFAVLNKLGQDVQRLRGMSV